VGSLDLADSGKVLQIQPDVTYRKYKESAHMSLAAHPISQPSFDISPIWTPSLKQKSEKYNSGLFRIHGKLYFSYVGTTQMPLF
jgi:hypothetical protein